MHKGFYTIPKLNRCILTGDLTALDFKAIADMTSPEAAEKLQDDAYCNRQYENRQQNIDGLLLDDLTRGAVIIGVEPVDYPLTDGLYIYMKRPAGDVIALYIEAELTDPGGTYEALEISKIQITNSIRQEGKT